MDRTSAFSWHGFYKGTKERCGLNRKIRDYKRTGSVSKGKPVGFKESAGIKNTSRCKEFLDIHTFLALITNISLTLFYDHTSLRLSQAKLGTL